MAGPPALRELVMLAGFPFRACGEPAEAEVAPIRERLPTAPPAEASMLANRDLFGRLATAAMLPGMEQACTEWQPDLVLREPCEYASAVVANRLAIRTAQVAISLAQVEAASIAVAAPALEAHRKGLVDELTAAPYLTRFPASLDPSSFPATVRFREPPSVGRGPLPDWWGGSTAPLVYLTFGTVLGHMSVAAGVYRTGLRAVERLGARVLLTTGRKFDSADLGPIPDNVRVEPWVDQADVFEAADIVVCHGGSGTAFGAMAAGVPVVVVPLFADQFENGRRIADAGAGLVVGPASEVAGGARRLIEEQDAARIAEGIGTVLSDEAYRRHARRIAVEIAVAPTADALLGTLLSGDVPGRR